MPKVISVPHIQQTGKDSCGAAALAMIYQYLGFKDAQQDIWNRLRESRKLAKGNMITVDKMTEDIGKKNLFWFRGNVIWQDKGVAFDPVEQFLQSGIPVIVCQSWRKGSPLGHFRVLIGIEKNRVFINDPENAKGKTVVNKSRFLSLWSKASDEIMGGVFIAIFKKDNLPKLKSLKLSGFWGSIKSFEVDSFEWGH